METRPLETHAFMGTIVGRCLRCQRYEAEHAPLLAVPNPLTGCTVDHDTILSSRIFVEDGMEWQRCPDCNVMVEQGFTMDGPKGPAWTAGRGDLTARLMQRLRGWRGWVDFLDGQR